MNVKRAKSRISSLLQFSGYQTGYAEDRKYIKARKPNTTGYSITIQVSEVLHADYDNHILVHILDANRNRSKAFIFTEDNLGNYVFVKDLINN